MSTLKKPLRLKDRLKLIFKKDWKFDQLVNSSKPEGTLDKETALRLQQIYITERYNPINNIIGYEDTREFVFELSRLKQYIAYVENYAEEKGYSDLGLRFYLSAYPPEFHGNEKTETTIFIAPAAKEGPFNREYRSHSKLNFNATNNAESDGNGYENIQDLDALNFSHGGRPPKNYE